MCLCVYVFGFRLQKLIHYEVNVISDTGNLLTR